MQPPRFILWQLVDITVLENAISEYKLLCCAVDQQGAFQELAAIMACENAFASKIEMNGLKAFAIDNPLFRWAIAHRAKRTWRAFTFLPLQRGRLPVVAFWGGNFCSNLAFMNGIILLAFPSINLNFPVHWPQLSRPIDLNKPANYNQI